MPLTHRTDSATSSTYQAHSPWLPPVYIRCNGTQQCVATVFQTPMDKGHTTHTKTLSLSAVPKQMRRNIDKQSPHHPLVQAVRHDGITPSGQATILQGNYPTDHCHTYTSAHINKLARPLGLPRQWPAHFLKISTTEQPCPSLAKSKRAYFLQPIRTTLWALES